jgi:hypothetical protein
MWPHFEFSVTPSPDNPHYGLHAGGLAHVVTDGSFPDNEQEARDHLARKHYYIEEMTRTDPMPPEYVRGISEEIYQSVINTGIGSEVIGWAKE